MQQKCKRRNFFFLPTQNLRGKKIREPILVKYFLKEVHFLSFLALFWKNLEKPLKSDGKMDLNMIRRQVSNVPYLQASRVVLYLLSCVIYIAESVWITNGYSYTKNRTELMHFSCFSEQFSKLFCNQDCLVFFWIKEQVDKTFFLVFDKLLFLVLKREFLQRGVFMSSLLSIS